MPVLHALARVPRLIALVAAGVTCTALSLASYGGPLKLQNAEGFAAAVANLEAAAPDFVLVWPPHAASALGSLPPQLRAADALPSRTADRRRLQQLAVLGPAGFATPPELDDAELRGTERFGDVEVRRFAYPAEDRVLFDLRRDLSRVAVFVRGGEAEVRCDAPRPAGGFSCPTLPEWAYVAPEAVRVEGNDWDGVWAHPLQGREIVLELGEQPLGDRIELEAALSDSAVLTPNGAPVNVTVEILGPTPQHRNLQRSNHGGVARLSVPAGGGSAQVVVRISTARDARRHFALNLRIVERAKR